MAIIIDGEDHKRITNPVYDIADRESGVMDIHEQSEMGEVFDKMFEDTVDEKTKMTSIDMKTDLHPVEISGITAVDSLVTFRVLPMSCLPFTRIKKRLSVSKGGRGRNDGVSMINGKREQDAKIGGSLIGKVGSLFKRDDPPGGQ